MSSIEKLSIQGIRSFGHEEPDKQIIQFFHPLTLIVGQNGAGKTTIIECLRYVCSGDQPPGVKNAFVHDPKVAHETEVKGQVKLKFKDKLGENVIVTRNLSATQKAKRIEFKSLEGTIRRVTEFGAKSISSRCAEIDREMVEALGVSKSVLTNVIFCHQEEANWPLSEAKTLKNKFDDIFAATRYIKALDNIKKIRQEQASNIKEFSIESRYLRDDKDRAINLADNLEKQQARLSAAQEDVGKLKDQMMPLHNQVTEIEDREAVVQSLDKEIAKLKAGKEQMEVNCREIEDGLESVFDGSIEELKRMFKNHNKESQVKKEKLDESEKECKGLSNTVEKLRDKKSRLLTIQGKLEQEAEDHAKVKNDRMAFVKKMSERMKIAGFHGLGELSNQQLSRFKEQVEAQKASSLKEWRQLKQQFVEKETSIDGEIQGLRDTRSKLQQSVEMKTNDMKTNKDEVQRITAELNQMEENAHILQELDEELKKTQREYDKLEKSVNLEQLRGEIETLQREKRQKDKHMGDLSKEMSKISLQSENRTQLEMWEKEKKDKEDSIKRLRNKHEEEMTHLMGHFPSENARNKLEDFLQLKRRDVAKTMDQVQTSRMQLSREQASQGHILDQLKEKQTELRSIEEKFMLECGSQDVGNSLQTLQQSISNLQSEKGALTGSTHLYERYIRSLQRAEAQCPLCHRGFDAEEEVHELVQELQDKLRLAPAKLKEKEKSLVQQREKLSKLQKLQPLKEKMSKLSEQEIPDWKTKLASVTEKLGKLTTKIEEEEESLCMLQGDETMAVNMKPDINMLEQYLVDLKPLARKIGAARQQISGDVRTIQEVNRERGDLEIQLDTVNRTLEHKQSQRDDYTEDLQIRGASINSIKSERFRLAEKLQQQDQLQTIKTELIVTNETLKTDIQSSKDEVKPIETKLKKLEYEKKELSIKKDKDLSDAQMRTNQISDDLQEVNRYSKLIDSYLLSGKAEHLRNSQSKIEDLTNKVTNAQTEESNLKEVIDSLKKDIVGQEVQEREMYDNIQLQKKRLEVQDANERIKSFESERGQHDSSDLRNKKQSMNKVLSRLSREKNQADGKQSVLKEEVKKLERELNSEKFKEAKDKYMDIMIKLKTSEIASKDLDKYYKALDTAIMRYHNIKMEEINKIIKEYWRMTYKGNDIDFIEIRSEADSSTSTSLRKSYNYRVVMVKGDTDMDMRGRCSAGQKVLASLIIRLALAETFCLTCGILALDEPTTNLDRVNIEGLAHALVDIIKSRENQQNFQLIIITHDEDFVELLGRSDYADHFYRVSKNNEAKSIVCKKDISTLQT